jgi:hypothetical protein
MGSVLPPFEPQLRQAIAHYWNTLSQQSLRQAKGDIDRGNRAAVTGGKQMDGFCDLIRWLLVYNGLEDPHIYTRGKRQLPGYFRATKEWDLLVVHEGHLVAAMEFKSQRGPSFSNNVNNRIEEALGSATDLWTAHREGAFGLMRSRPWLGWIMLLEDCAASTTPVRTDEPHFPVFGEFKNASYAKRYELLARKLMLEKLYDRTALLLATASGGHQGDYRELADDLTIRAFLADLAGHVAAFVAAKPQ